LSLRAFLSEAIYRLDRLGIASAKACPEPVEGTPRKDATIVVQIPICESMNSIKQNLFSNIPESFPEEIFETLLENNRFKLERILSSGQATPENDWYDQEKDEWVVLLKGKAGLRFENESEVIELTPGDHLLIPAHKKHRLEWTDEKQKTVWLALHFDS